MTAASSSISQASNRITGRLLTAAGQVAHEAASAVESMTPVAEQLVDAQRVALSAQVGRALLGVYLTGWAVGEHAARHTLTLTKADTPDETVLDLLGLVEEIGVNWDDWTPGDLKAAGIVYGDGLRALLTAVLGQPGNDGWTARAAARGSVLASIADTRLDKLANVLAQSLAEGWAVDSLETEITGLLDNPTWADQVATTETARAMTAATLATYAEHQVAEKQFLVAPDDRVCPACAENAAEGPVPLTSGFVNGDPPVHPSCRCALLPILAEQPPELTLEGDQ